MLRNHLLICFVLLLLCIPVYLLVQYSSKSSGGNWITLDFSNLLIRAFILFIALHIAVSTLTVIYFHRFNLLKTHLFSAILSFALIGSGFFLYDKLHNYSFRKNRDAITKQRESHFNDVRLKRWWFSPDEKNPTEIHVDVAIASPGRLAANAKGIEKGEDGKTIFSSDGEEQRLVKAGETIHYMFPLTINNPGQANDIEFTFYLFKHPFGQSDLDDVTKIFKDSINTDDDGSYFYEKLVPPVDTISK